jgi:hypothetical protein
MTSVSNESSRRSSRKEMKRVSSRDSATDKEARDDGEDSDNNLPYTQPSKTVASNVKVIKKRDKSPRYTYTLVNDDYLATVENPNSVDPNGIYSVNYGNNMKSRSNAHRLNTNI